MATYLKTVVNSIAEDDLLTYFAEIPYLSSVVNVFKRKYEKEKNVIAKIVQYCKKNGISEKVGGHLDLLSVVVNQELNEWQLYEFRDQTDCFEEPNNPELLMRRIERKLQLGYSASSQSFLKDKILWFRVHITNPILKASETVMYAAYSLRSCVIVATFSNIQEKNTILKAVASALNYHNCKELMLKGRCVRSLMRLHWEKNNSGYKIKSKPRNPLVTFQSSNSDCKNIKRWNKSDVENREREEYLRNVFGDSQQPLLQHVQFDIQTSFHGRSEFFPKSEQFSCKVVFEGPSVLESFREMVQEGLITQPLPKHLENIRMNGTNYITLNSKST